MNEPQSTWVEVSRAPQRKKCQEHALVLQAMAIESGILQTEGQFVVVARAQEAARAATEIERYERENVGWPPRETVPISMSQGLHAAIVYCGLMALAFMMQRSEQYGVDWLALGRGDAALIRSGEWWRCITALSLHGDLMHVLGNMAFGALFTIVLSQSIGTGLAWLGFVLSGALGNLINAWIQSPDHRSIGASTAVFGALGIQVAYEWMRRRELGYSRLRRWAPLIGGAVLLAFLGAGGGHSETDTTRERLKELESALEKVDVMAHITGFAAGAAMGLLLGLREQRIRLTLTQQIVLAGTAPLLIVAAWCVALASH